MGQPLAVREPAPSADDGDRSEGDESSQGNQRGDDLPEVEVGSRFHGMNGAASPLPRAVIQLTPQVVATDGYRSRTFAYVRRIGFTYPLPMPAYENLDAWKAAHALGLAVWRLTEGWTGQEAAWMGDEMRTVAFHAPLRIVHGAGRLLRKPFQRHVDMALGYLMELHYLLRRAEELGLLSGKQRRELDGLRGRAVFYTTRLFVSLASSPGDGA